MPRRLLERIKNIGKKQKDEDKPPAPRPPGELEYNTRPERLDHTFADKHKLDGVVQKSGGREEAVRLMLEQLGSQNLPNGKFVEVITVHGEQITVRGFVDNGVIKIGTAFIP